jgi:hypothetical protein
MKIPEKPTAFSEEILHSGGKKYVTKVQNDSIPDPTMLHLSDPVRTASLAPLGGQYTAALSQHHAICAHIAATS